MDSDKKASVNLARDTDDKLRAKYDKEKSEKSDPTANELAKPVKTPEAVEASRKS